MLSKSPLWFRISLFSKVNTVYSQARAHTQLTCIPDTVKYGISKLTVMGGLPSISSFSTLGRPKLARIRNSLPPWRERDRETDRQTKKRERGADRYREKNYRKSEIVHIGP
jgi:hypothetical protein